MIRRGRVRLGGRRGAARVAATSAAVLVPVLLAGCAGIPEKGPVVVGRAVGEIPAVRLRISPAGPTVGDSPEGIVRGFLRAAADVSDDRHVARTFLTGARQESWRADASVVIYSGGSALNTRRLSPSPATAAATTGQAAAAGRAGAAPGPADGAQALVQIEVPVQARVGADGEYRIAAPGDTERRTFGLIANGGQWRIDTLSDGSILTRADFDTTYSDLALYFPDPTGGWLVPDVRWFPVGDALPTALVKAVLTGPSPWLAPAVTSGAPPGTRLTASSVPVQQGVALVDLTHSARQADAVHRQMLRGQLETTLGVLSLMSQVPVDHVSLTVESRAFEVSKSVDTSGDEARRPIEQNPRLLTSPVVDDAPVVVRQGQLMRLSSGQLIPVSRVKGLSGALSWPAVATDGTAYAALLGGNRLLYALNGGSAVTLVSGLGVLTPPSFDPLGWVWTAATSGHDIRASRPEHPVVRVTTTGWPRGLTVSSLRISRDGTRAVVTGQNGKAGVVFVSAVERDGNQVPVRLGPPQMLLPDLASARSAAWLDQRHVVLLGRRGTQPERPWSVEVGGNAEPLPLVPGAIGVTAGNGDIYAATTGGVQKLAVTTWVKVSPARWPAMPG